MPIILMSSNPLFPGFFHRPPSAPRHQRQNPSFTTFTTLTETAHQPWTDGEITTKRRIVLAWRDRPGAPQSSTAPIPISCILSDEIGQAVITSPDFFKLFGSLHMTNITADLKKTMRRDMDRLENYITIKKKGQEYSRLFRVVTTFPDPKPVLYHRDFKVFPLTCVDAALKLLQEKYSLTPPLWHYYTIPTRSPIGDNGLVFPPRWQSARSGTDPLSPPFVLRDIAASNSSFQITPQNLVQSPLPQPHPTRQIPPSQFFSPPFTQTSSLIEPLSFPRDTTASINQNPQIGGQNLFQPPFPQPHPTLHHRPVPSLSSPFIPTSSGPLSFPLDATQPNLQIMGQGVFQSPFPRNEAIPQPTLQYPSSSCSYAASGFSTESRRAPNRTWFSGPNPAQYPGPSVGCLSYPR